MNALRKDENVLHTLMREMPHVRLDHMNGKDKTDQPPEKNLQGENKR